MASPLLGSNIRVNVVHGQGVHGHIPVILIITTYRALDLGVSIKKQKKIEVGPSHQVVCLPQHMEVLDHITDAEQYWRHWNYYAEEALLIAAGLGSELKGRGEIIAYTKKHTQRSTGPHHRMCS